jgi:hypothetical protein
MKIDLFKSEIHGIEYVRKVKKTNISSHLPFPSVNFPHRFDFVPDKVFQLHSFYDPNLSAMTEHDPYQFREIGGGEGDLQQGVERVGELTQVQNNLS